MEKYHDQLKGRGTQLNTPNPFQKNQYDTEETDGLDEALVPDPTTEYIIEQPKTIINKVKSPDIPAEYSMNPYQGCEHGCVYCYARNTHEFWGYSAGLDFERKIVVKQNAAELLAKTLDGKKWKPAPVMFSGNTDCYQPIERKLAITRACLEVFLRYKHPVSLITKNSLILRDLDLLTKLAELRLVQVFVSITTLDEVLRRAMEPRTTSGQKRLDTIRQLTDAGIPVGVMIAPIIPGLNSHEIPGIMEASAQAGAKTAGFTLVRLNGPVADIFEHWIRLHFPDRADKVLNQIRSVRGGELGEKRFGKRMRGEGSAADSIVSLYKLAKKRFMPNGELPAYDTSIFQPPGDGQLSLF